MRKALHARLLGSGVTKNAPKRLDALRMQMLVELFPLRLDLV
jgi:hypothetical protein